MVAKKAFCLRLLPAEEKLLDKLYTAYHKVDERWSKNAIIAAAIIGLADKAKKQSRQSVLDEIQNLEKKGYELRRRDK